MKDSPAEKRIHQALYYERLVDDHCACILCPRGCVIAPGSFGHCGARANAGGTLVLPYYGLISSIAIDPVEKKPLRMFLPGSLTYSVGFWHCTMDCPFCQNWEIAHPDKVERRYLEPAQLVAMALTSGCPSISFTYSEPCLHIEYLIEAMTLARSAGLKTILVTNGNLRPEPAASVLPLTDATNVDLKTWIPDRYGKILGGDIKAVKAFIALAYRLCHVEVTSLLVPGVLDTPDQIEKIARFLAGISRTIPLHITPYHEAYLWDKRPLGAAESARIAEPAFALIDHVYYQPPWLH
ncbi:MAG: radical SAM protein [Spirochaetes bacterium]|nr:radical SAM protein [Spirochaetota bacterium]